MRSIFLVLFIITFAQISLSSSTKMESDRKIVNSLKNHLDLGLYLGTNEFGKCVVFVTQGDFAPGTLSMSRYLLEILQKKEFGWYAFSTNRNIGGRGDCATINEDDDLVLKIKNQGPLAPCFSNPKKSNSKGLELAKADNGRIDVTTFGGDGSPEAHCRIFPKPEKE